MSKIIQSAGSFGSWLGNLGKKALTDFAIPLARDSLTGWVSKLTSNAINKFEREINGKGAVRAGKNFLYLFWMKILMISLEDSGVLIDRVIETVKNEMKKRRRISWSFVSTFSRFNGASSNFFSSKKDKWNRS